MKNHTHTYHPSREKDLNVLFQSYNIILYIILVVLFFINICVSMEVEVTSFLTGFFVLRYRNWNADFTHLMLRGTLTILKTFWVYLFKKIVPFLEKMVPQSGFTKIGVDYLFILNLLWRKGCCCSNYIQVKLC